MSLLVLSCRRTIAATAAAALILTGLAAAGWAGFLQFSGNIHAVVPGELYRSARLSPAALEDLVAAEGIRTVINLEGARPGTPHYDAERGVVAQIGIAHYDFAWKASRQPSRAEVDAFLAAVRGAPKPILIHCRSGADRTGLAVALYLAAVAGLDEATAEGQLSFRYGHVSLPFTGAWAMDEAFEREEPRLGFGDS